MNDKLTVTKADSAFEYQRTIAVTLDKQSATITVRRNKKTRSTEWQTVVDIDMRYSSMRLFDASDVLLMSEAWRLAAELMTELNAIAIKPVRPTPSGNALLRQIADGAIVQSTDDRFTHRSTAWKTRDGKTVTKSTVDTLLEYGWIAQTKVSDRTYQLSITDAGRAIIATAKAKAG